MRPGSSSSRPSRTKLWRTARKQNTRIETKKKCDLWTFDLPPGDLASKHCLFCCVFEQKKWRNLTKCWAWHVNVDSKHRRINGLQSLKILFFNLPFPCFNDIVLSDGMAVWVRGTHVDLRKQRYNNKSPENGSHWAKRITKWKNVGRYC